MRTNLLILSLVLLVSACAATPDVRPTDMPGASAEAAQHALAMVGTPYRYGGSSPSGFDCSGLVVYAFSRAGARNLPRTAAELEERSRPIELSELRPGDLLFFRLYGRKTSHVGLYVGDSAFVHAPSSGKGVERVGFDHVYWSSRIERAGRLEF